MLADTTVVELDKRLDRVLDKVIGAALTPCNSPLPSVPKGLFLGTSSFDISASEAE